MKSNVVLCVLNRIFPMQNEEGEYSFPKEESYYSPDLEKSFTGIQANEAPIKSLIQKAHDSGDDINEIIYLCSNECSKQTIPAAAIKSLKAFKDCDREKISVEEFFVDRIYEFCQECGASTPAFNPLPYTPSRPADCIPTLNEFLDESFVLSIDITGGRRDTVILQMLATQLLKLRSPQNLFGDVVYSNYSDKQITLQNTTFSLIELIEAVSAFTNYGRADRLSAYFNKRKYITDETRSLCRAMEDFSDSLAICQIADIDEKVKNVQEAMRSVDIAVSRLCANYTLVSDAINAMDNPNAFEWELSPEEALDSIRQSDLPIDVDVESKEELQSKLEQIRWDYTVFRGELLLYSLLPTMRERFIDAAQSNDRLIINTIRWCVEHQMLQQAMCIYREKISECLLAAGFFKPTSYFNSLEAKAQKKLIIDLGLKCYIGKRPYNAIYFQENPNYGDDYNDYFSINKEMSNQLCTVIAWYKYLHGTRNMIMHVDSSQDTVSYIFACHYLEKQNEGKIDIHELENDIKSALECIDEPQQVNRETWNSALNKAWKKMNAKK